MRAAVAASVLAAMLGLAVAAAGAGTSEGETRALAARPSLGRAILVEVNALRSARGLRPLQVSAALGRAAELHSVDMARKGFFAHESGDGSAFSTRIRRFYSASGWRTWRVGENLLWGSPGLSPDQAVHLWLNSPQHRRNLLTPAWREIGLSAVHAGAAGGEFRGREVTIVTANFGARSR